MLAGTMLVVPGWLGRGLALLATAGYLFSMGAIDWQDHLVGARDYRFSRGINRILAVLLHNVGSLALVLHLLKRPGPDHADAQPRPAGQTAA